MSIASEITRLQTAKADLKTAIEGKGVTVSSSAKLDAYPELVESIQAGGGGDDIVEVDLYGMSTSSANPYIINVPEESECVFVVKNDDEDTRQYFTYKIGSVMAIDVYDVKANMKLLYHGANSVRARLFA